MITITKGWCGDNTDHGQNNKGVEGEMERGKRLVVRPDGNRLTTGKYNKLKRNPERAACIILL